MNTLNKENSDLVVALRAAAQFLEDQRNGRYAHACRDAADLAENLKAAPALGRFPITKSEWIVSFRDEVQRGTRIRLELFVSDEDLASLPEAGREHLAEAFFSHRDAV